MSQGYVLPEVIYDPEKHTLAVVPKGVAWEWVGSEFCTIKLGKRQEAFIKNYIEDMKKLGKVKP